MKIRCFEENDIKTIYELLKNELGYEVDYSLFILRVQEMIKNNYLIYVACIYIFYDLNHLYNPYYSLFGIHKHQHL